MSHPNSSSSNIENPLSEIGSQQIDQILVSLEDHLSQQLRNHKMFLDDIQSIEEERNFYYRKLRLIEDNCMAVGKCESKKSIMEIVESVPEDFSRGTAVKKH